MHLHIVALDRQYTVITEEDAPLGAALDEAFRFHGKSRTKELGVATLDGHRCDPAKTPEENGLVGDEVVLVKPEADLPSPVVIPTAASIRATGGRSAADGAPAPVVKAGKGKGKKSSTSTTVSSPPVESSAPPINFAALRRGRDLR
jgi:hypothetical protein